MSYVNFIKEVFEDHHDSMGMSAEEIADLMEETTVDQMEKFLSKEYSLRELYFSTL